MTRTVPWLLMLILPATFSLSNGAEVGSENAALQYWLAFELMPNIKPEQIWNATTDDPKFGFAVPVNEEVANIFRGDGAQSIKFLHRGAALANCDWATDMRKDGPAAPAPYGEAARRLARLSCLRARWYFEHGQWNAGVDDVIATMVLARHIGRGKVWFSINYGCMIENICVTTLAVYLPQMPEESRRRLSMELDKLPAFTTMREVLQNHDQIAID